MDEGEGGRDRRVVEMEGGREQSLTFARKVPRLNQPLKILNEGNLDRAKQQVKSKKIDQK